MLFRYYSVLFNRNRIRIAYRDSLLVAGIYFDPLFTIGSRIKNKQHLHSRHLATYLVYYRWRSASIAGRYGYTKPITSPHHLIQQKGTFYIIFPSRQSIFCFVMRSIAIQRKKISIRTNNLRPFVWTLADSSKRKQISIRRRKGPQYTSINLCGVYLPGVLQTVFPTQHNNNLQTIMFFLYKLRLNLEAFTSFIKNIC